MEDKKCDCVFCNSICPECGSEDINVKLKISYEFHNETKNIIRLQQQELMEIEFQCNECDLWIVNEEDKRLTPLWEAWNKYLIHEGLIKDFEVKRMMGQLPHILN